MNTYIINEIEEIEKSLLYLKQMNNKILNISDICIQSLCNKNKIIFCGNGGSAAQAQHLAAELVGRYKMERRALSAISLTVDTSNITAIGNDYGYDDIFRRQLEGIGNEGDVLIGLSTSGNSKNVINAFLLAKEMKIKTIAFIGSTGGRMKDIADVYISVPSYETNHIQEMHIIIGHIVCGIIEKKIFQK